MLYLIEILHQTTTLLAFPLVPVLLYLIEILHQTTTTQVSLVPLVLLYLIEILHQTTTSCRRKLLWWSCILLKFYIKPQLRLERELARCSCILLKFYIKPQRVFWQYNSPYVVSYWNSTSNHNLMAKVATFILLYLIEILHQTTTFSGAFNNTSSCILLKFYIKPQHRPD